MRRGLLFLLLFFVLSNLVVGLIDPEGNNENYEKIQNATGQIPLDSSGNVDQAKLNSSILFVNSKAQERIDNINAWMETNLSWLHLFFRMIPSISWLFAWNLYFILLALTYLVVNYKIYLGPFFENDVYGLIFGSVLFLVLLFSGAYVFLAQITINVIDIFWNIILPWGIAIAVILVIVFIIVIAAMAYFCPQVLFALARMAGRLMGRKIAANVAENVANRAAARAEKAAKAAEDAAKVERKRDDAVGDT